jgi:hypothetical protein
MNDNQPKRVYNLTVHGRCLVYGPMEAEDFRHAARSLDYYFCLTDLAEAFRQHRKYGAKPVTEDRFYELIKERGIELP